MPVLVLICEAATVLFLGMFCVALAYDRIRGSVFRIDVTDPVGRFLIRIVQCAFVLELDGIISINRKL
jgi:hypothetical protein